MIEKFEQIEKYERMEVKPLQRRRRRVRLLGFPASGLVLHVEHDLVNLRNSRYTVLVDDYYGDEPECLPWQAQEWIVYGAEIADV